MGAQFYPSCTQIRVTKGGSTELPAGVALPGAYNPDDPGVSLGTIYAVIHQQLIYGILDFDRVVENQPRPSDLHGAWRSCVERGSAERKQSWPINRVNGKKQENSVLGFYDLLTGSQAGKCYGDKAM